MIAIAVAAFIGAFQGSFVALIGVPAFVVTLAGLLAWQGVIQTSIGDGGPIVIENRWINYTESYFFSKNASWLIALLLSAFFVGGVLFGVIGQRRHGVPIRNPYLVVARIIAVPAATFLVVAICNHDRGVPLAGLEIIFFLLFWHYIATANDVRPPRVRGRRQPGSGAPRRHQRARASASWSSRSPG